MSEASRNEFYGYIPLCDFNANEKGANMNHSKIRMLKVYWLLLN